MQNDNYIVTRSQHMAGSSRCECEQEWNVQWSRAAGLQRKSHVNLRSISHDNYKDVAPTVPRKVRARVTMQNKEGFLPKGGPPPTLAQPNCHRDTRAESSDGRGGTRNGALKVLRRKHGRTLEAMKCAAVTNNTRTNYGLRPPPTDYG